MNLFCYYLIIKLIFIIKEVIFIANTHIFSKKEELANSITHGIGVLFSIVALVLLVVSSSIHGTPWHIISFTLFGTTMFLLYTSSTLVHAFPQGKVKDFFEICDHSSIYFFIAGTYTPFLFLVVKGWLGWTLFSIVWAIAIGGTIFKIFFVKRFLFISTGFYVLMGWLIVFAWSPIVENLPKNGILFLVVGGLLYTVGSIFYVWRAFKYHHAVWHIFVLAASILHFLCVILYVLPIKI